MNELYNSLPIICFNRICTPHSYSQSLCSSLKEYEKQTVFIQLHLRKKEDIFYTLNSTRNYLYTHQLLGVSGVYKSVTMMANWVPACLHFPEGPSLWRCAAHGKDTRWRSSWRTVPRGRDPTLEQGRVWGITSWGRSGRDNVWWTGHSPIPHPPVWLLGGEGGENQEWSGATKKGGVRRC